MLGGVLGVQHVPGVGPHLAIYVHFVFQLELLYGVLGGKTEPSVRLQGVMPGAGITDTVEPGLHQGHIRAGGAPMEQGIISRDRHRSHAPFPPCYAAGEGSVTRPAPGWCGKQCAGSTSPRSAGAGCSPRTPDRFLPAGHSRRRRHGTARGTARTTSSARCRSRW